MKNTKKGFSKSMKVVAEKICFCPPQFFRTGDATVRGFSPPPQIISKMSKMVGAIFQKRELKILMTRENDAIDHVISIVFQKCIQGLKYSARLKVPKSRAKTKVRHFARLLLKIPCVQPMPVTCRSHWTSTCQFLKSDSDIAPFCKSPKPQEK